MFVTLFSLSKFLVADHSVSKEYDETKEVQIEGKVTKVDWSNPHVQVFIEAPNSQGKGTMMVWVIELANPKQLMELGWSKDTVSAGTTLRVKGPPALDHSSKMSGSTVTIIPTGESLQHSQHLEQAHRTK